MAQGCSVCVAVTGGGKRLRSELEAGPSTWASTLGLGSQPVRNVWPLWPGGLCLPQPLLRAEKQLGPGCFWAAAGAHGSADGPAACGTRRGWL